MNEKVAPIPAGFTTITPHLLVKDAEEAFAFYQKAFGQQKILSRQTHPSENWLFLDLEKTGNSILMLTGLLKEWMLLHTRQSTRYNRSLQTLCRRLDKT